MKEVRKYLLSSESKHTGNFTDQKSCDMIQFHKSQQSWTAKEPKRSWFTSQIPSSRAYWRWGWNFRQRQGSEMIYLNISLPMSFTKEATSARFRWSLFLKYLGNNYIFFLQVLCMTSCLVQYPLMTVENINYKSLNFK